MEERKVTEAPRKTILYLCRCGPNIADHLDLEALESWAAEREGIEVVESHDLLCSPDGKKAFREALEGREAHSIVLGACSPKMHEKTFQDIAEDAGANMAQVQMANIREHCAWVTQDRERATDKAKALITAAVRRANLAEKLEHRSMDVQTDVLVIGGGIAGMEAALTAAAADRKVYLVERDISIGGAVIRSEEVAPVMECGPCLLAPVLAQVKEHPCIEVITNAEVQEIVGFYGNFTARVLKRARFVEESCIGCELCYDVCPVEVDSPFHLGMGKWKAVHALFQGSVPAAAVIDPSACTKLNGQGCEAPCAPICPFESVNFEQQDEVVEVQAGAVVLATGFTPADLSGFPELGHGRLPEVYTLSEFERLVSSNGPTGGKIKRRDGSVPGTIAVVHCAGSLRDDGLPYCSGICCVNAVKVGTLARMQNPEVKVINLHRDLVFAGPREQRFFAQARAGGTEFLNLGDALQSVRVAAGQGTALTVSADGVEPLAADMVVLANGMVPAEGTEQLARMLNLERDTDGYPLADDALLHPTRSAIDGVYLAGCAAGPCDVATSVTRARAAAGDAISRLMPGRKIDLEVMTSSIDEELCAGCKLCVIVCPYKAVSYDEEGRICKINEVICRGCGTCTAGCPSGASRARHFTDEQIYAEMGGLLDD